MLLDSNVINYNLLSVYVHICIECECLDSVLYSTTYIYARGMLRAWPIHVMTLNPIGLFKWMIMYMLDICISYALQCILNYYHYIPLF